MDMNINEVTVTATCINCAGPAFGPGCNPDKGCEERYGLPLEGPAPSVRRARALAYIAKHTR